MDMDLLYIYQNKQLSKTPQWAKIRGLRCLYLCFVCWYHIHLILSSYNTRQRLNQPTFQVFLCHSPWNMMGQQAQRIKSPAWVIHAFWKILVIGNIMNNVSCRTMDEFPSLPDHQSDVSNSNCQTLRSISLPRNTSPFWILLNRAIVIGPLVLCSWPRGPE
jgi:hypothetical protein